MQFLLKPVRDSFHRRWTEIALVSAAAYVLTPYLWK
jgi:hypothetical protein